MENLINLGIAKIQWFINQCINFINMLITDFQEILPELAVAFGGLFVVYLAYVILMDDGYR